MKTKILILLLSFFAFTAMAQTGPKVNTNNGRKPTISSGRTGTTTGSKPSGSSSGRTGGKTSGKRNSGNSSNSNSGNSYGSGGYSSGNSGYSYDNSSNSSGSNSSSSSSNSYSSSSSSTRYYHSQGYFVKSGNNWTEYRNEKPSEVWNSYTQYSDDKDFYYIKNDRYTLAIPKSPYTNNVFMSQDGKWNVCYYHAVTGTFYHTRGRFVAEGNNWTEYLDKKTDGAWATYYCYSIDDNFYYLKNENCEVAVPKNDKVNDFYLKDGDDWNVVYNHKTY